MPSIHDQIEEVLAAAVHNELSDEERRALHVHLVECAECRELHKEEQLMHRALGEVFADEKPDFGFEKRMLYAFRHKAPQRADFSTIISGLLRSRGTQIAAAAALMLALMQMGRFITGEDASSPFNREPRTGWLGGVEAKDAGAAPQIATGNGQSASAPQRYGAFAALKTDNERAVAAQAFADSVNQSATVGAANAPASLPEQDELARGRDEKSKSSSPMFRETAGALEKPSAVRAGAAAQGQVESTTVAATPAVSAGRKVVRNARVDLEVRSFEEAIQAIAAFAKENGGYLATSSSQKQENGKLRGEVVVKVLPDNLDGFLEKLRELGELKNQTLGNDDVTKQYFDTDARLKNAQAMEQQLLEVLKKKSDDINDLLAVEKELGRVREQIEELQGELKFMDTQVQFATVTIALAEKDMDVPAGFLLKERAQLALYAGDVEKTYNNIKALASPRIQITNATLDRDNSGRVSARVSMLIAPEESDAVIDKVKSMGRVENFQMQAERVARGGRGMSEEAKTERDKVQLNITISRDEQEAALQQTSLRIRASNVSERAKQLRALAEKQGGRVRASSFARDPNGREFANVSLRVAMKSYNGLMQALGTLGKLENVSVHRDEPPDAQIDDATAPADITVQVYSQGRIVTEDTGLMATLRRTLSQGAAALMWSVQMIGVALAFLAPWLLPVVLVIWLIRWIARTRSARRVR